jgi:2-keto-3-deoxy-L-rhamnonate aldolase RhmA
MFRSLEGAVPHTSRSLRARLLDGARVIGTFIKSRDPLVAEAVAVAGYDFVIADLEHSPLSLADVAGIVQACSRYGVPVLAAAPPSALELAGPLLDRGVTGIQVGVPSIGAAVAAQDAVRVAVRAARADAVVLTGQIGSRAGLAAIDEIAAAGVFDVLFADSAELSVALGHPGDVWHPAVLAALKEASEAIRGSEAAFGISCADVEAALHWARRGACMLAMSSDLTMLKSAAEAVLRQYREDA